MSRHYYLGPWVWDDVSEPGTPQYRAPEGTVGLIDLRPVAPTLAMGFFAFNDDHALGSDYSDFGDGVNRLEDVVLSPAQRSLWSSALGIGSIAGGTLLDALWETLTIHGDPDGGVICPPLMPTHRGILELHLGGHSLVKSEQFTGPGHPAWPKIQALVQRNYRGVRTNGQSEAGLLRSLRENPRPQPNTPQFSLWMQVDAMKRRLGVDFNTARDALAGERKIIHSKYLECMRRKLRCPWESLIPGDLPQEPPRRPSTTITESFNTADSDTLGPDLTWMETTGDLDVSSNLCVVTASGWARAGSDLSSDDMYSQHVGSNVGSSRQTYAIARWSSSADDFYNFISRNAATVTHRLFRYNAGVSTQIGTTVNATPPSQPYTTKCTADGSSIDAQINDSVVVGPVTDTNHTGFTRAGLGGAPPGTNFMDDFEASDLVAAAGVVRQMMQLS